MFTFRLFIQTKNYKLGSFFSYLANPHNQVGIYIASDPLSPEDYYFEVEILDSGNLATIGEIWCHNIIDKMNENLYDLAEHYKSF